MYKYENIKKVLTYLPSVILEEESEPNCIKWALQAYRSNVRNIHTTDDVKFCIMQINNHKTTLPVGFKKFIEVIYMDRLPDDTLSDSNTIFLQPDINGIYTTVFSRIFWQYFKPTSSLMRYIGTSSSYFDNGCLNVLCDDCGIGFSVSKDGTSLTIDTDEGYVAMLYTANIQNDNGDYLVVDNDVLWQALAAYITAMHFKDRSLRKEDGTHNMFIEHLTMANNLFKTFQKEDVLRKFNPQDYFLKTIFVRQMAQVSNNQDYYNYKRR